MYGRSKCDGKWHTFDGETAHCSRVIKIVETRPFITTPDGMCERCSKKNLTSVEKKDDGGVLPMDICEDFLESSQIIPKTLKNSLWCKEVGKLKGEANCPVCVRTIYATTFKCGHIISIENGGETTIDNLKCICYQCHKRQGSQNLEDYMNNFFNGKYDGKTIKQSIPRYTKIALWNITNGSATREAKCYVCPNKITSDNFQAGHVVSESKGGTINITNLRCICSTCNQSMGNHHLEEFKNKYFP